MERAVDELAGLIAVLIAVAILGILLGILLLVYLAITGVIAIVIYQRYYQAAEQEYQQLEDELTGGLSTDSILRSLYGAGIDLSDNGAENTIDWATETLFGEEVDRAA
jgi:hypothetical protein